MDVMRELSLLSEPLDLEVEAVPNRPYTLAGSEQCPAPANHSADDDLPISYVAMPNGKRKAVLKTLMTSACERNCYYCPFRAGRDFRRATIKPDDMARTIVTLTQAGRIEGAFLSSGIAGGGVRTQDQILATADILRHKYQYRSYLHLKLMPGAERDQVERAMQLADRVSVNLEAPNTRRLTLLAPQKIFMDELLKPMRMVEEIRRSQPDHRGWNRHWPSITTQFVVGAVGENDLELMQAAAYLYRNLRLARAYFSGFSPVRDTPFENLPAINPWREHRLYQASFLLRDYDFTLEDLPFEGEGNLPLDVDPKLAWARQNLAESPLEVNHANRRDLLRVPGIGPVGAQSILNARRRGERLHSLEDLKALGVAAPARAAPFLLLDGFRPPVQMRLL